MTKRTRQRPPATPPPESPPLSNRELEHKRIQELKDLARHDKDARQELLSLADKSRRGGSKIALSDLTLTSPGHARITQIPSPQPFQPPVPAKPPSPAQAPTKEPAFDVISRPPSSPATDPSPINTKPTKTIGRRRRTASRTSTKPRRAPYKYIEDAIQKEAAAWISTTDLALDWLHPPLEQFNARWAKQMADKGASSGWPDFMFFRPTKTGFAGLAIELKRPDREREDNPHAGVSKNQEDKLNRLESFHWFTAVAYSTEQIKALVLHHYGPLGPPPPQPPKQPVKRRKR